MTATTTPIKDRLERIRARRDAPRPLYPSKPVTFSPFVRAAREKRLTPTLLNGAYVPAGSERGA